MAVAYCNCTHHNVPPSVSYHLVTDGIHYTEELWNASNTSLDEICTAQTETIFHRVKAVPGQRKVNIILKQIYSECESKENMARMPPEEL